MRSEYERHGAKTAPGNGKPKQIISGHTPDELTRWKHCLAYSVRTLEAARAMVELAEAEIKRLEQYGP